MKHVLGKAGTLLLAVLLITGYGCGSSEKKKSMSNDYPGGDVKQTGFEVNGDSDSGTAGGLRTVYFALDSSSLGSEAKATLESNAQFLNENSGVKVQVEGHADERGGVQYNLALGERRAKTVKNYLVGLGVSSSRIDIVSYGKERPLEFGHDEGSWSKNRRGNFVITAK